MENKRDIMIGSKNKMIGYHYTSYSNWLKIKKTGLFPYEINKPELKKFFPNGIMGIWTWQNNLHGIEHDGSVIFQMASKGEYRVAKLRYEYSNDEILRFLGGKVQICHNGKISAIKGEFENDFIYHNETKAWILTRPIEPKRITLVGVYGISDMPIKNLTSDNG